MNTPGAPAPNHHRAGQLAMGLGALVVGAVRAGGAAG